MPPHFKKCEGFDPLSIWGGGYLQKAEFSAWKFKKWFLTLGWMGVVEKNIDQCVMPKLYVFNLKPALLGINFLTVFWLTSFQVKDFLLA
jgi:hypothetical protein